ncbi:hypothetical protein [Lapillicoccus sp.]|uniref:hypothetical protein n=1 Tax=Lapillicoccus sp. TaxID=1909287 RepID=UPI00326737E9
MEIGRNGEEGPSIPEHNVQRRPNVAQAARLPEDAAVIVRRRDLYDEQARLWEIEASYLPAEYAAGTFLAVPLIVPQGATPRP